MHGERVLPVEGLVADAAGVDKLAGEVDGLNVHPDAILLLVRFSTGTTEEIASCRVFGDILIKHRQCSIGNVVSGSYRPFKKFSFIMNQ